MPCRWFRERSLQKSSQARFGQAVTASCLTPLVAQNSVWHPSGSAFTSGVFPGLRVNSSLGEVIPGRSIVSATWFWSGYASPPLGRGGKEKNEMARQDTLAQITQTLGAVPDWLSGLPDPQLEYQWGLIAWLLSDSALSSRDKALVAFGAATAVHCPY